MRYKVSGESFMEARKCKGLFTFAWLGKTNLVCFPIWKIFVGRK
jgi:hypothetical protein